MFVKIMSGEDIPDNDNRKQFTIIQNVRTACTRRATRDVLAVGSDHKPTVKQSTAVYLDVTHGDGRCETLEIEGNAYLMSDAGRTVAAFGFSPYPRPEFLVAGNGQVGDIPSGASDEVVLGTQGTMHPNMQV